MATLSEVGPGSFDAYEGIRIVIPGLLTYGIASVAFRTVAPSEKATLLENPLTGIVAALAIGLLLYYLDVPARAASYSANQPTDYLKEQYPDIQPGELLTAYLLLLNTRMPSNTRNRALYMGSMYRIGVEMVLTLAIASSVVFGASILTYGPNREPVSEHATRFSAVALIVVFVIAVWGSAAYGPFKLRQRAKAFIYSFWTWSMVMYCIGVTLIAVPVLLTRYDKLPVLQNHYVAVIGLAIATTYWVWRYIRGDSLRKSVSSDRKPLDSPFAGFILLLPLVLILCLYVPQDRNVLPNAAYLVGWTSAAGLAVALIVIRGHERKLHGVYRGQTRWLQDNSKEVATFLGVSKESAALTPEPLRVDIAVAGFTPSGRSGVLTELKRLLSRST